MTKPRHGARVDGTQPAIVTALQERGAKVLVLDVSEDGAPDLAVLWLGAVTLLEVKARGKKPDAGQKKWHDEAAMRGVRVHVVRSLGEATDAIGMTGERAEENRRAAAEMCAKPPAPNPGQKALAMALGMRPSVRSYR